MKQQSGNVLIFILIAIFLLGGLTVLMSRTSGQSEDTGDIEQLSIKASEILRTTGGISSAVQSLLQRGCSENTINFFASQSASNYTNPSAPADESCNVFSSLGAGLSYKKPKTEWLDTSKSALPFYGELMWPRLTIVGVGTDGANASNRDLLVSISYLQKSLCVRLNKHLGVANPLGNPPTELGYNHTSDVMYFGNFSGGSSHTIGNDPGSEELIGKKSACYFDSDAGFYTFYHVLIPR